MTIQKLLQACNSFEKLAQLLNKRPSPEQKKEIDLWSNTLLSGFRGAGTYLYSAGRAKQIFDSIAAYNNSPAYGNPAELKQIEALLTAITFSQTKLKALGLDPTTVLKQKGVQNVSPTSLDILKTNLETLRDGKNFSAYRHYFIAAPGTPRDVIELDEPEAVKNEAGY